ncbi:MAG TPA: type II secretion system F family protein [Nevskiaceae bacterium]|nr:type II secretion system F family protein [Nevskiaceae bacterium]
MEQLYTLLGNHLVIGALTALIGASVMLGSFAALRAAGMRADPLRRRLAELGQQVQDSVPKAAPGNLGKALQPLAPFLLPKKEEERETLRLKLIRAGFRSDAAAINLYLAKMILFAALPAIVVGWLGSSTEVQPVYIMFFGAWAAFIGMFLPNLYLRHRIGARQQEMMNSLPDALDLLVSCTEAGLGLNGALQRVARQMHISSPLLAHELEQVNAEIRGGVDRIVALKNLAVRTGLEEIRGLVSLLSQSLRFGTPIADILRIYAEEFRDKRSQRAEEQAALVGTKLIFPLCFCIFPAFFVVAVGPAVIGVTRAMSGVHFGS